MPSCDLEGDAAWVCQEGGGRVVKVVLDGLIAGGEEKNKCQQPNPGTARSAVRDPGLMQDLWLGKAKIMQRP